jgi:hypothetical protein
MTSIREWGAITVISPLLRIVSQVRPATTACGTARQPANSSSFEYIFSQQDFAAGASWSYVPLNSVPIPPIDNVHILHYNGAKPEAPGTFTAHMYFIPEETYLAWEKEPPVL